MLGLGTPAAVADGSPEVVLVADTEFVTAELLGETVLVGAVVGAAEGLEALLSGVSVDIGAVGDADSDVTEPSWVLVAVPAVLVGAEEGAEEGAAVCVGLTLLALLPTVADGVAAALVAEGRLCPGVV